MTYEETVSTLLTDLLPARGKKSTSLIPLFAALGCPHLIYTDDDNFDIVVPVKQPADRTEIVGSALMQVLAVTAKHALRFEEEISMLAGLSRDGHWRRCLDARGSSYALVKSLAFLTEMFAHGERRQVEGRWNLMLIVTPDVCAMLNEWLQPAKPFTEMPSMETITRSLFGNAWCDLMLDAVRDGGVGDLIRSQKPPFLPGLVASQVETEAMVLPDIGCT